MKRKHTGLAGGGGDGLAPARATEVAISQRRLRSSGRRKQSVALINDGGRPSGEGVLLDRLGKGTDESANAPNDPQEHQSFHGSRKTSYFFAGGEDTLSEGSGEACDAEIVSINSGCLGGFPIGVGAALSGEGGLAFAVQTEVTSPGTGELIITGKVGASMRESAAVALAWVKARNRDIAAWMGLDASSMTVDLERRDQDVHVHFPSCEAEKNGPSAGATIATSLVLMLSGAKLRPRIAISGEINLRGELLQIGNVKEKVVAAARQGLTHIVMPSANIKAFRRLPPKIRNSIKALKSDHMVEVLQHALVLEGPRGFRPEFESAVRSCEGMGIAASLACTHTKGHVQRVECCATAGRGQWFLTGNIHEGASGSVLVARTWVRKHSQEIASRLGTSARVDLCRMRPASTGDGSPTVDVHVHLPQTEVAKDVSIYGAASAAAMMSIMTGVHVRPDVAVLGEVTLAGVLWPLEQVNEAEVLTAKSAGIKHLILPKDNLRQIQGVAPEFRRGLKITGAVRLMDILDCLFDTGGKSSDCMDVEEEEAEEDVDENYEGEDGADEQEDEEEEQRGLFKLPSTRPLS